MSDWSPDSWRSRIAVQQPRYRSDEAASRVVSTIAQLPPLVTSWEIEALKAQLGEAARGERFLLQGGDCAESFDDCNPATVTNKLKILLQMSLVLVQGGGKRVTRVGRIAGQYAKPRSEDPETRDGVALPAYRGDIVNRPAFTAQDREPDPDLMLRGYERAALTLNFIRALVKGGFADLHHPEYWNLDFVRDSPRAGEFERMAASVGESLRFMENVLGLHPSEMGWVDFFTSHEGLHLLYEQAQTRRVPHRDGWYNLSTHMPWIGLRTSDPDGAHVEYFRGLANPIGLKVGPQTTPEVLSRLVETLDPAAEPGRLTLIHRFGRGRIAACLPALVESVRRTGRRVVWCSDPMHGNTRLTSDGIKTRGLDDILGELDQAFAIHADLGSALGGVHIELTGDDVTECVGGARGLAEADLKRAYRSQVDPRLNYEQALELALLIARRMNADRARPGAAP